MKTRKVGPRRPMKKFATCRAPPGDDTHLDDNWGDP